LIHLIERECTAPAYLVGHSLGGYVSVLAAAKRPDLVRGVVLIDSPLLSGLLARALQLAKPSGLIKRFSPGHVSQRRRQHWPSADAAFDHFSAKAMFVRWQPEVLRDYIACGLEPDAQGQTLAFRREIETAIYNTLPHHMGRLLRLHPLQCPMAFIGGTESNEVRRVGMRATLRLTRGQVSWIAGSHLFPFEKPAETAADVLHWLAQFSGALMGD
jgi:pimeloyl-ACP methyl ester carboxylesterase